MARVLLATVPIAGHIAPLLSVACALYARGHEVFWYTGSKYRAKVESTGARHLPFLRARDYDDAALELTFPERTRHAGLAQLRFDIKHVFTDAAPGQLDDLRRIAFALAPDVVVADPTMLGALFLKELTGIPLLMVSVVPNALPSRDVAPFGLGLPPSAGVFGRVRNQVLGSLVNHVLFRDVQAHWATTRANLGLSVQSSIFAASAEASVLALPTIPSFEYPRSDLPENVRFIGCLPGEAPADVSSQRLLDALDPRRPIVHVTQGTVANTEPSLIAPALAGLADEEVHVLIATGGRSAEELGLGKLPDNAHVVPFFNYRELLPRTAVMVTNGGYGGVQAALSHGVPLVVAGDTEDKPEVAARVAWSGAGVRLASAAPRAEEVHAAVRHVLDDTSFKRRALELQGEYAVLDGVSNAVRLVEDLVESDTLIRMRPRGAAWERATRFVAAR